ncbi:MULTISPECIES: glutamate--tRNA ligase [unclassified Campylobacter]|uniref:glutamate--tRNA ligase n=1 Tax=unclassified Campylobacter TaxID=2593542 RepID=UPI001237C4CB|nr:MULTISPECIES: glutamate--tRNA ligase [unclassified Campylobacter]KAA6225088.1 glutamate--tRNA ligase [Campylobacter sp. LR196d]KAA6226102.1 glutamate--tRNA ligase [Campylobacter sp. LR185c]KAA6228049.1 glutamate--tRNA ligase [Campylobacter sp. LR286c]KAA6231302.1 glutamate--tRNA ligase [Campylobacter sp. LR264d]KAA6231514.1 glutamate--tRNA ligase [Campylobacter sp. LR291e]
MNEIITTRFAPSPTGYLHIGGLRTALYNYLYARKNKGKFLLRIEDTDLQRNSEEATKAILEAFEWIGLNYDEKVEYQSKRFDIYKKYIQKLLDEGKAYYCYMSKDELEALRKEQEAAKQRPRYNGKFRNFKGAPPSDIKPVVRIKAPLMGEICFNDGIKGEMKFKVEDILDDFIIARSDGSPTYNFTVVVDDALMGVSDVIRGDDHLSNTPKQIILYEALNFKIPKFFHVAMIHGEDGKKLSKRHGATDVMEYKKIGILPQALLNFLVRLGWSHNDDEIFSLQELENIFDPHNIGKSASSYNFKKLEWLNAHYIKTLPFDELNKQLKEFNFDLSKFEKAGFLLDLLRPRAKNLLDIINSANTIVNRPKSYNEKAVAKFINENNIKLLTEFSLRLKNESTTKEFEDFTNAFLEENKTNLKELAQPIRIALTGSAVSPSIFEMLEFLGVNESKERINLFLKGKNELRK